MVLSVRWQAMDPIQMARQLNISRGFRCFNSKEAIPALVASVAQMLSNTMGCVKSFQTAKTDFRLDIVVLLCPGSMDSEFVECQALACLKTQ